MLLAWRIARNSRAGCNIPTEIWQWSLVWYFCKDSSFKFWKKYPAIQTKILYAIWGTRMAVCSCPLVVNEVGSGGGVVCFFVWMRSECVGSNDSWMLAEIIHSSGKTWVESWIISRSWIEMNGWDFFSTWLVPMQWGLNRFRVVRMLDYEILLRKQKSRPTHGTRQSEPKVIMTLTSHMTPEMFNF